MNCLYPLHLSVLEQRQPASCALMIASHLSCTIPRRCLYIFCGCVYFQFLSTPQGKENNSSDLNIHVAQLQLFWIPRMCPRWSVLHSLNIYLSEGVAKGRSFFSFRDNLGEALSPLLRPLQLRPSPPCWGSRGGSRGPQGGPLARAAGSWDGLCVHHAGEPESSPAGPRGSR